MKMEQTDILNRLFERVAQNQFQYFIVGAINVDGSFEVVESGSASYLEKIGLAESVKDDIKDSIYLEEGE